MYNISVFLDSSAVEHSAVNRTVTGSNPVQGVFYGLLVEWLRCVPFTDETRGSIPLQAICGIICLMFSGGVTVAQRFLVPLVGVRISTGESLPR